VSYIYILNTYDKGCVVVNSYILQPYGEKGCAKPAVDSTKLRDDCARLHKLRGMVIKPITHNEYNEFFIEEPYKFPEATPEPEPEPETETEPEVEATPEPETAPETEPETEPEVDYFAELSATKTTSDMRSWVRSYGIEDDINMGSKANILQDVKHYLKTHPKLTKVE